MGGIFSELEQEALRRFGSLKNSILFDRAIDMRYAGQEHTVATQFLPGADSMRCWRPFTLRMRRPIPSGFQTPRLNW